MSAETLRRAASLMRKRAEKAADQPAVEARVDGVWLRSRFYMTWHPAVALAVADWLTFEASMPEILKTRAQALNVARAYLGEQP